MSREAFQKPIIPTILLAAGLGLTACGNVSDGEVTRLGTVDELCGAIAPGVLGEAEPLAPLSGDMMPDLGETFRLGELTVKEGVVSLVIAGRLPTDWKTAIRGAVGNLEACAAARSGWEINFFLNPASEDDAHYGGTGDKVGVGIGLGRKDNSREFLINSAILQLGTGHELDHGFVDNWLEAMANGKSAQDREVAASIQVLHRTYEGQVMDAAEAFRAKHGDNAIEKLSAVSKIAAERGDEDMVRAANKVIQLLGVKDGLEKFALHGATSGHPYAGANTFGSIISLAAEMDSDALAADEYKTQFEELANEYFMFLEDYFSIVDESSAFADVISNWRVGHPYENFNEWLASMLNRLRYDYAGFWVDVKALGDRGFSYRLAHDELAKLSGKASPELYDAIFARQ